MYKLMIQSMRMTLPPTKRLPVILIGSFLSDGSFKVTLWQKINYDFSLDIKTMLTKHYVTQVLSLDLKKVHVNFNWNFSI